MPLLAINGLTLNNHKQERFTFSTALLNHRPPESLVSFQSPSPPYQQALPLLSFYRDDFDSLTYGRRAKALYH